MGQYVARLAALATIGAESLAIGVCIVACGFGVRPNHQAVAHTSTSIPRPTATGTSAHAPMTMTVTMAMAPGLMDSARSEPAPPRPGASTVSVASLTGPRIAAHVRAFTLVARPARLRLGAATVVDAWTYNGTAPGPTLRVRQGDLVVVRLVNRLPVPTTIHWHGVAVPGGEDGVAGLTQNAVAPGRSYTYRFVARDAGTYWYHAHQDSLTQVARGLYGALVVTPAAPAPPPGTRDDVDATVVLHSWQVGGKDTLSANGAIGPLRIAARPGDRVRLRLVNTDVDTRLVTLVGAPFTVTALDGRDLNGPQALINTLLPIAAGGRYDLRFHVPKGAAAGLYLADDRRGVMPALAVAGAGMLPPPGPTRGRATFDFTRYGAPRRGALSLSARADAYYTLRLGDQTPHGRGFAAVAHPDPVYTINGKAGSDITPIMVKRGQLVRIHIVNESDYVHPMHLHGHTLVVLARGGRPLRDSPVSLDTLDVLPGESYDVAFRANNPGIWMLHCHNLYHARYGMSMMVMYEGIGTPFKPGGRAGNISD